MATNTRDPSVTSIEDVLSKVRWVANLPDPSVAIDELNNAFHEVIFSFPVDDSPQHDEVRSRVKSAAEKKREEKQKRKMRRELEELRYTAGGEDDEDSFVEDDLADEEDDLDLDAREELAAADEEFLSWIDIHHPHEEDTCASAPESRQDIELEMSRVGLGAQQMATAADDLPERYVELGKAEKRHRLGSKELPGGYTYDLPLEKEAYWILRQLRNAGQPLAHNNRICALANHPLSEVRDDPVMVAITYALHKMTREFMEPAHLMMYHHSHLHPVLFALFEESNLQKDGEHTVPMTSYAYSTRTGCRQRPILKENYVGFDTLSHRPIGRRDPSWSSIREDTDFTQRKPCFIELGRLLVRILELDVLCHQLEYRRCQMLLMLGSSTDARVQNQRAVLQRTVFESSVDVDIWHSFVQSLVGGGTRGRPHRRIQELGLQEAFEEYSLTELQYQENLLLDAVQSLCPSHRIRLHDWAERIGINSPKKMRADEVISLFNDAIVDQFSKLPVLCKKVIELFCTEGRLIVTHNYVKRPDDIYHISSFFVEHPRQYLELLELKNQGKIDLHYVVKESFIRGVLQENKLYHSYATPEDSSTADVERDWYTERQSAFTGLVAELMKSVVPRVKAELRAHARYQTTKESVERLGTFCAQGPYQRTKLTLRQFSEDVLLWEPEWNTVEALPVAAPSAPRVSERVCGVYRSDNGVITFAFIDEMGTLIKNTRWADLDMSTENGKAVDVHNQTQLQQIFERCTPSVVAVAASAPDSLDMMQRIQHFLKERIYGNLRVSIPVVWVPADVPRFFSESRFADLEMANTDTGLRISIGLARYVQDPLNVIATLFDSRKTALQLFCNSFQYSRKDQAEELYSALSWEMSLWVGATGFWLDDCIRRPNSVAVLQFVSGLGILKATVLLEEVNKNRPVDRVTLHGVLEELYHSSSVAVNASSMIRISPASMSGVLMDSTWHPLDQTLIPLHQYPVATFIAAVARHHPDIQSVALRQLQLIEFLSSGVTTRRRDVDKELRNSRDIYDLVKDRNVEGSEGIFGPREIDFIADELIANGASFMRRPYRRITTKGLLFSIAGVAFFTNDESNLRMPAYNNAEHDFIIQQDSYISGTIEGFRAGKNSGIRVMTSRGVRAFIPAADIEDDSVRAAVMDRIHHLKVSQMVNYPQTAYVPPEWLERGAVIQGTVFRCNWSRCELLLRWCPLKAGEIETTRDTAFVSYADVIRDGISSANSLRTAQIEANASIFASKISAHPLARTVSHDDAVNLLRDKEIGEVLLRPSSHGKSSKAVCMVKVGDIATCNLGISEERRPDGQIFYLFKDTIIKEENEFNEVDEFLQKYIKPMVSLVKNLRAHRRFVPRMQEVESALNEQQHGTNSFAYVFVESTTKLRPPLYRVCTRGGGKEHQFRLHITDKFICVHLPFISNKQVLYAWVKCGNAELLSDVVKQHAIGSSVQ